MKRYQEYEIYSFRDIYNEYRSYLFAYAYQCATASKERKNAANA